jgi:hypothetical protein
MTTDTLLILFHFSTSNISSFTQTFSDMPALLPRPQPVRTVNSIEIQSVVSVHVTLSRLVATSRDHHFTFSVASHFLNVATAHFSGL